MRVYRLWISDYLRYIHPETPTRQNAMSYLAALKNHRYTKGKNKDEPYSASTLHQAFRSLRTWFNWLASEDEGILPRSPLAGVKAPKLPQRIHRTFDAEQMARIILWCSQPGFHHSRNKAMIYIIYDTGMRVWNWRPCSGRMSISGPARSGSSVKVTRKGFSGSRWKRERYCKPTCTNVLTTSPRSGYPRSGGR